MALSRKPARTSANATRSLPRDLEVAGDMPLELDQQIPRGDERAIDEPTPL